MDISVSRLNNRMTLQVPSELPLGLVFITGQVGELSTPYGESDRSLVAFRLHDEQHQLPCRVPQQVVEETQMEAGDRIRVSGHLLFDARSVHYYLLARDLEVLPSREPQPAAAPVTTATVQQRAQAASLVQGELPPWVKQLAPREVQAELGLLAEAEQMELPPVPALPRPGAEAELEELPPVMLDFLSSAIDSDEDIELTPEMVRKYLPTAGKEERQPPTEHPRSTGDAPPATGKQRARKSRPDADVQNGKAPGVAGLPRVRPSGEVKGQKKADNRQRWLLISLLLLLLSMLLLFALVWSWLGTNVAGILSVGMV